MTIDHLSMKFLIFYRYTAIFKILFSKVQDLANLELSSFHIYELIPWDVHSRSLIRERFVEIFFSSTIVYTNCS